MPRIVRTIPLLLILMLFCYTARAMAGNNAWTPIGPYGGDIRSIAVSPEYATDRTVMTGIWNGLFSTSDNGLHWQSVPGMEYLSIHKVVFSPDYANDRTILAGGHLGLFRSTDAGATWTKIVIAPPPAPDQNITALAVSPSFPAKPVILAGTDYGTLFRSVDNGVNWAPVHSSTGLTNIADVAFASNDEAFLIPGAGYIRKSSDAGATWQQTTLGTSRGYAILPDPDYGTTRRVLAATATGARFSSDSGLSWNTVAGLAGEVFSLAASPVAGDGQVMYAGTSFGVYRSDNGGTSWNLLREGTSSAVAAASDSTVLAADLTDMMVSNDSGASWNWRSEGILGIEVRKVIPSASFADDGIIYVASLNGGVFRSADRGASWNRVSTGFSEVRSLAVAPAANGGHTLLAGTETRGIFKSSDSGQNWVPFNDGIDLTGPTPTVFDLAISPTYPTDDVQLGTILAQGVHVRNAAGIWTRPAGLPVNLSGETHAYSVAFSPAFAADRTAFAGMFGMNDLGGVYRSTDGGMTWSPANTGLANIYNVFPQVNAIAPSPAFATDRTILTATDYSGLFRSLDGGNSWTPFNEGLEGLAVQDIRAIDFSPQYVTDRTVFLADLYQDVFRTDGGSGWSPVGPGISGYIRSLAVSPGYGTDHTLFAGTSRGVQAYTIDDRSAPVSAITSPAAGSRLSAPRIEITGTASDDNGIGIVRVEVSTDNGVTWQTAGNKGGIRQFASWEYAFTPPGPGVYQLRSRATDRLGNVETPAAATTLTVYTYPLDIIVTPPQGGSVLISPGSSNGYHAGSEVTLTPTPAEGYVFTKWSGDAGGTTSPLTLVMSQGRTVTATFARNGTFLTATQQGRRVACSGELFSAGAPLSGKIIRFYSRTYSETGATWPAKWTARGSATTVNGTARKTINLPPGRYQIKAVSTMGESQLATEIRIGQPRLDTPANASVTTSHSPAVSWAPLSGATGYLLQSCPKSSFAAGTFKETAYGAGSNSGQLPRLPRGVRQYWRVVGIMPLGLSLPATPRSILYREGTTLTNLAAGVTGSSIQPSVTLTGNDSAGAGVAGKTVTFFYRKSAATAWRSAGSARTGTDGTARLARERKLLPGSYDIRATFKGDGAFAPATEVIVSGVTLP